jgi:lipopolysaccharide biosynthesis protein
VTPAEEINAAARRLRPSSQTVAHHTVAVRLHPAVVEALAELLAATGEWAREYPEMAHDHDRPACEDYACDVMGRSINLARTILGDQP